MPRQAIKPLRLPRPGTECRVKNGHARLKGKKQADVLPLGK
jgi:hypothetical protein